MISLNIEEKLNNQTGYSFASSLVHDVLEKWVELKKDIPELKTATRCRICTLSEHYKPAIPIIDGVCAICRNTSVPAKAKEQQKMSITSSMLHPILRDHKRKGKNGGYDLIVMFSGGKDSTYMLQMFKNHYPHLNMLALTIDNGYRTPISLVNAANITAEIGVDHKLIKSNNAIFKKMFRHFMDNHYPEGSNFFEAMTGELMQDAARRFAVEHKIPLIALGYTPEQCAHMAYKELRPFYPDSFIMTPEYQLSLTRKTIHGEPMANVFSKEEYDYFWHGPRYVNHEVVPTMIYPFLTWGYNKIEITESARQVASIQEVHPFLTNNVIATFFADFKMLGYCSIEPEWADMVRKKVADYTDNLCAWEGFEYMAMNHSELFYNNMGEMIDKLGFTKEEFMQYLEK